MDQIQYKQVLTILKKEDVKANFFLIGEKVNEYPKIVEQIVQEGHDIGGHSMTHKELTKISLDKAEKEITDSMDLVNKYQKTNRFRFPYGSFNKVLDQFVKNLGYRNIYWDIDTVDWKYKDRDTICKKFAIHLSKAPDSAIILMHDIHPQTVASLETIIKDIKDNNIDITKIP